MERQAHLHWSSNNQQKKCFCNPEIHLDVTRIRPTPETIAALFGISDPSAISTVDRSATSSEPLGLIDGSWQLEPQQHYDVVVSSAGNEDNNDFVPIGEFFQLFPGDTDDDKTASIEKLSNTFYDKIWKDPETPTDFRDKFWSASSTVEIQAFRQSNWFYEVFGAPNSMYANAEERDSILGKKTMAKHTSSRMTKEHAVTWLVIMKKTIREIFPRQNKLEEALNLYWLHFYAFFPYTDEERQAFRQTLLES